MPLSLQAKLLRVLQSGEVTPVGGKSPEIVDVRILAATHRDIESEVRAGRFREDLLYRLRVVPIHLPPLRERTDDIVALAEYFTQRYCAELSGSSIALDQATLDRLARHDWPGNVRELENVIERAVILADTDRITLQNLPEAIVSAVGTRGGETGSFSLKRAKRTAEAEIIRRALIATGGNRTHAAKLLEISHRALLYKIKEYGISD